MLRFLESFLRRAAGPLLLLAIMIGLFWKLTLSGGQFTWLSSPDLSTQVLPWFQFQAREWNRHHFPLWDPYNWGGQSLVGRTEPGVMYPLNWLLFLAPLDGGRISTVALNWYYVLTHYLGALFCYLLCRDLGRSRAASVLAGAAFGAGGYVGSTSWPHMVNGAVWGPLVVMFFLRAARGERPWRSAALSGAFLGVALLSGHHQIPTLLMLLIGGLWIYHLAASGFQWRRWAGIAALLAGFAFLLGAAQVLPSLEYGKLAVRWVGSQQDPLGWQDKVPYLVHAYWALNPVSLLGVVLPGIHPYTDPYMGFAVVALALLAVTALWARHEVRLFGGIAVGGFLFALGGASVLHGVIYSLAPMVEKARNPSMAAYLFGFGLAVLAAFGLDAIAEADERGRTAAAKLGTGLWAAAGTVYVALFAIYLAQEGKVYTYWRPANAAVGALLIGATLIAWRRRAITERAARVSLVLLVIFELGNVAGYELLHRGQGWGFLNNLETNADLAKFLKSQEGPFRVDIQRDDIAFNFGEWHEIEEWGGNSGVTANIFRVNGEPNAHMLMNERFAVGRKPTRPGQADVFTAASGLKVFRNSEAFPRVWTVHEMKSIASEREIAPEIRKPLSELRRQAFLTGAAPQLTPCDGADEVRILERGKSRTLIRTQMACRGMLIIGDTYFPGWRATVDGRRTPLYETYGFLRGVVVDAGEHRVELRYRPASVMWGAALTAIGILAAAVLLLRR